MANAEATALADADQLGLPPQGAGVRPAQAAELKDVKASQQLTWRGKVQFTPAQILAFCRILLSPKEASTEAGCTDNMWQQNLPSEIARLISRSFWDAKRAQEREVAVQIAFPDLAASGTVVPLRMMPGQTVADLRRLLAGSSVNLGPIGPVSEAALRYPLVHNLRELRDTAHIGDLDSSATTISVELRPRVIRHRVRQTRAIIIHLIHNTPNGIVREPTEMSLPTIVAGNRLARATLPFVVVVQVRCTLRQRKSRFRTPRKHVPVLQLLGGGVLPCRGVCDMESVETPTCFGSAFNYPNIGPQLITVVF